ncbi:hypothetical protein IC762_21495 [Bradyrhizobium genosp. L]|uniref:hypothetical protein n=1 Tax=Bradyrhizobium genosp. L TaxID=83637 RepID=UPI0018A2833C|nr:hypothetical protein [Bradyrhizobium genosp. L]QPF82336.1 hypothetical protein IC762_21495 [Bradyrhizobium genosp. L]
MVAIWSLRSLSRFSPIAARAGVMTARNGFIWAFPSFSRRSGYFAAGIRIKTSCLEFLSLGEGIHIFHQLVHLDPAASYTGTAAKTQIRE